MSANLQAYADWALSKVSKATARDGTVPTGTLLRCKTKLKIAPAEAEELLTQVRSNGWLRCVNKRWYRP